MRGETTEHRIKATDRQGNIHHKAGSPGSGHAHAFLRFADSMPTIHLNRVAGPTLGNSACKMMTKNKLKWPGT